MCTDDFNNYIASTFCKIVEHCTVNFEFVLNDLVGCKVRCVLVRRILLSIASSFSFSVFAKLIVFPNIYSSLVDTTLQN